MAGAGGGCGSSPPPSHKGPSEVARHAERSTSEWYRRTSDATQNAPNVADGGSSFFWQSGIPVQWATLVSRRTEMTTTTRRGNIPSRRTPQVTKEFPPPTDSGPRASLRGAL